MTTSKRFSIAELLQKSADGQEVLVNGWVKTRRDSKAGCSFITINDGSNFKGLQLVASNQLPNYTTEVLKLTTGCAITATGKLVKSIGAGQDVELQVDSITVTGWVENPEHYPISAKFHTVEYLREYAHLRARSNLISVVTRIRHGISMAIHQFFNQNGFYWIHTPLITTSDCEGAGEMFRVTTLDLAKVPLNDQKKIDFTQDFFGKESFLTVSGQLNVESYCCAMGRVYTFGPTFRAENSNTGRHLAEFWMVEPEIAWADLNENAEWAIGVLKHIASYVLEHYPEELAFLTKRVDSEVTNRLEHLVASEVKYLDYTDAIDILTKAPQKFKYPVFWGADLQSEHERYLTEQVFKSPVILKNYPQAIKSFYMRLNDDGKTVAAMDVLVPGIGEIIGGSQREERLELLTKRIKELKLDLNTYQWYLDLRRYGSIPHSGFGLGLERMVMYVTGVSNIRDVIAFPRTPKHADF